MRLTEEKREFLRAHGYDVHQGYMCYLFTLKPRNWKERIKDFINHRYHTVGTYDPYRDNGVQLFQGSDLTVEERQHHVERIRELLSKGPREI